MLMNAADVFMQNNSLFMAYRRWWAEKAVIQFYRRFFDEFRERTAIEIGCGSGCGTAAITAHFKDIVLTAIDLDPRLVATARRKANGDRVAFDVADACSLACEDGAYDAVFDFGAIHHIAEWRSCLAEINRILRPGGKAFFVESPIESFRTPLGRIVRTYTLHPYDEMFSEADFLQELKGLGFSAVLHHTYDPILYYFVLVARKEALSC